MPRFGTSTRVGLFTLILGSLVAMPYPASATPDATLPVGGGSHRIVYEADPDGDGAMQIYTLLPDSLTPRLVTPEAATNPTISRSGDIYYTRVITPVWGIITKIYHRASLTAPEMGVTKNELADEYDPCISRDNQVLAFTAGRYHQPKVGPQTTTIELMAYKRPFIEQRQLTQSTAVESDPVVDATGTYIYCTITDGAKSEVWRYRYADASAERIAGLEDGKETKCMNPGVDGQNRWCVYASLRDGNSEIYIRDLKTMVETRLTNHEGFDGEPSLSEDGSLIAFVSDRDGDKEIFLMNRDGSNLRQLTINDFEDNAPSIQ